MQPPERQGSDAPSPEERAGGLVDVPVHAAFASYRAAVGLGDVQVGAPVKPGRGPAEPVEPLTPREREVLELVAQGCTNRMVAEKLVLSVGTVRVHVQHILKKFGVSDRTRAAVLGVELGVIPPPAPLPSADL